jgi:tellurite resistance protein TerC
LLTLVQLTAEAAPQTHSGVWLLWAGFVAMVIGLVTFDLAVLNRKAHVIGTREALGWPAFWVTLSMAFMGAVYVMYEHHWLGIGLNVPQLTGPPRDVSGKDAALTYLLGYVVEQSLSLDNMFVIAVIFAYFKVPAQYQHRVLFWGILGAVVARGVMIMLGAKLLKEFSWITYVFGALLLVSAVKMLVINDDDPDVEKNIFVRLAKKILPLHPQYEGTRFLVRIDGRLFMTPLMIVLLVVESADVMFAVDSIPAIFSITRDPFIVFTSNVFAILGLRSLFFALAGVMHRFKYVKASLVFVLAYIGVKMLLAHHYHIDALVSLTVIVGMLCIGVLASVVADRRAKSRSEPPFGVEVESFAKMALRQGWKLLILIVGTLLIIAAVPVGLLPGPGGAVVFIAGLMVLAIEFVWARRLLKRVRAEWHEAVRIARGIVGLKNEPRSTAIDADGMPPQPPDELVVRQAYSRVRRLLLWCASPFSRWARHERARMIAIRSAARPTPAAAAEHVPSDLTRDHEASS